MFVRRLLRHASPLRILGTPGIPGKLGIPGKIGMYSKLGMLATDHQSQYYLQHRSRQIALCAAATYSQIPKFDRSHQSRCCVWDSVLNLEATTQPTCSTTMPHIRSFSATSKTNAKGRKRDGALSKSSGSNRSGHSGDKTYSGQQGKGFNWTLIIGGTVVGTALAAILAYKYVFDVTTNHETVQEALRLVNESQLYDLIAGTTDEESNGDDNSSTTTSEEGNMMNDSSNSSSREKIQPALFPFVSGDVDDDAGKAQLRIPLGVGQEVLGRAVMLIEATSASHHNETVRKAHNWKLGMLVIEISDSKERFFYDRTANKFVRSPGNAELPQTQVLSKKRLMMYSTAIILPFVMMGFLYRRNQGIYVFRKVRSLAPKNSVIINALGDRVSVNRKYKGIATKHLANFSVDVEGSKGRGVIRVQGVCRPNGSWHISESTLTVSGRGSRIDVPFDV